MQYSGARSAERGWLICLLGAENISGVILMGGGGGGGYFHWDVKSCKRGGSDKVHELFKSHGITILRQRSPISPFLNFLVILRLIENFVEKYIALAYYRSK